MESKKYLTVTVRIIAKSNTKIVEIDQIDNPNTHILDRSLYWLGTGTSIKVAGLN